MSYEDRFEFTKENLDFFLKEVAKEYRKKSGKQMPAEIILIGGASALINYGFREMTTDADALLLGSSAMKDAINLVGDKYNLPNGWLNDDFKKTKSYSPNLSRYSQHYKTYSNIVEIRTVSAEYLISMKLKSGRRYKHDMSDIVGVLLEHSRRGEPITIEKIKTATVQLYNSWDNISEKSRKFIEGVIINGDYEKYYQKVIENEEKTKELLIGFDKEYPDVLTDSNIDDIINIAERRIDGKKETFKDRKATE